VRAAPAPSHRCGSVRSSRLLIQAGEDRRAESSLQRSREEEGHETREHAAEEESREQLAEVEGGRRGLVDQPTGRVGLERHQRRILETRHTDQKVARVRQAPEEGPPSVDPPHETPGPGIDRVQGAGVGGDEDVIVREERRRELGGIVQCVVPDGGAGLGVEGVHAPGHVDGEDLTVRRDRRRRPHPLQEVRLATRRDRVDHLRAPEGTAVFRVEREHATEGIEREHAPVRHDRRADQVRRILPARTPELVPALGVERHDLRRLFLAPQRGGEHPAGVQRDGARDR
jgi:hypothetical protein